MADNNTGSVPSIQPLDRRQEVKEEILAGMEEIQDVLKELDQIQITESDKIRELAVLVDQHWRLVGGSADLLGVDLTKCPEFKDWILNMDELQDFIKEPEEK